MSNTGTAVKKPVPVEYCRWTGDNGEQCQAFAPGMFQLLLDPSSRPYTAQIYDIKHDTWIKIVTDSVIIKGGPEHYWVNSPEEFENYHAIRRGTGIFAEAIDRPTYDYVVDALPFYRLISEHYGVPFNLQQHDPMDGQSSYRVMQVGAYEDEQDAVRDQVEIAAWQATKPPEGCGYEDYPDLWHMRENVIDFETLLWDLHRQGMIPAGEYLFLTDW